MTLQVFLFILNGGSAFRLWRWGPMGEPEKEIAVAYQRNPAVANHVTSNQSINHPYQYSIWILKQCFHAFKPYPLTHKIEWNVKVMSEVSSRIILLRRIKQWHITNEKVQNIACLEVWVVLYNFTLYICCVKKVKILSLTACLLKLQLILRSLCHCRHLFFLTPAVA